ncbi:MAG: CBS domain-containing protein [Bradyrhizobium sp.]|jgi:CBS domain-containing protein|uniref:CBS domain-containing protein n=1 Tax=Bradyrhizobium sp. TaxID=376 RepID=UPI003C7D6856
MIVDRLLAAARERLVMIASDAPLTAAAALLRDLDKDIVVVHDPEGRLAGIITKTDIVRQISRCQGAACMTAASAVMTQAVVFCRPSDLLREVWIVMKERHLKNIPILDQQSRPLGVLNARDALEALLEELQYEEVLLREYVTCVGYH